MTTTHFTDHELLNEEFRLTPHEARGEHLIVMILGCVVITMVSLLFFHTWLIVLVVGVVFGLYWWELQRHHHVMDFYTDELLNFPRVFARNIMTITSFPVSSTAAGPHKSERIRSLVRQLQARLGTQHPLCLELWQHGPYSITQKFQQLPNPEDRIYVADRLRELCRILN